MPQREAAGHEYSCSGYPISRCSFIEVKTRLATRPRAATPLITTLWSRKLLTALLLVIALVAVSAATAAPASLPRHLEPGDISDLQPVVEVRGRVADPAGKLAWDVPGTALGGEATLAADGSFIFQIETEGLHLTQSVRIVARDSAGRSDEQVLLLVDPDPGPLLTLDEPVVSLPGGPGLVVSGHVSDTSGGLPIGWLDSLSWSLPTTGRGGVIEVDQDGRFSAETDGAVQENGTVWLRAEDRFGHLTLRQVRFGGQKAVTETAACSRERLAEHRIILTRRHRLVPDSPDGRGPVRGAGASDEPLAWNVSGDKGQSGEILVDSDGTFRLELATGDLTRRPASCSRGAHGERRQTRGLGPAARRPTGARSADRFTRQRRRVRVAAAAQGFSDRSLCGHRRSWAASNRSPGRWPHSALPPGRSPVRGRSRSAPTEPSTSRSLPRA